MENVRPTGASASSRTVPAFGGGTINWPLWSLEVGGGLVRSSADGSEEGPRAASLDITWTPRRATHGSDWQSPVTVTSPTRLPWAALCSRQDSLCVCVCAQSRPTLFDPMDCSPPGSSDCEIAQARILEQEGDVCIPMADPCGCLPETNTIL